MFRKSAIALALLLTTLSLRLYALGLGEIDMHSALNQPMKADISLISVADVDLSQVKVTLASRQAHERLGLSRAKVLGDFKFAIVEDSRGTPVIHVSSYELIREPYLEFLLEMVWENGRIVREYTVLVDPPVTMSAAPSVPVAPVVRAPEPVPAVTDPVRQARSAPVPAASSYTSAPVQKKAVDQYGPVRREEALWGISERLRPGKDISVQQMMIALQRANPHAFVHNNINNLKAGATLKVPDRDTILALNKSQARAEAGRQYKNWREERDTGRVAVDAPVADEPAVDAPVMEAAVDTGAESQLKLTPPEGEPVAGSASTVDVGDPAAEAAEGDDIRQQLALASEEAEAGRAQSEELQSRVLELEAQVEKMQRLLELKSDELAGLQNQAVQPETEIVASDEAAVAGEEPSTEEAGDQEMLAEADAVETEAAEVEDTAAGDSTGAEPRSFVNRLMDNPMLAALGVLVAMLLGGILWSSIRKHSSQSLFDEDMTLDKHLSGERKDASVADGQVLNISDPGRFDVTATDDTDEASSDAANDPVTEADVYLAYGRIQQAEDVLQAALKDDPENIAIRAKLLWVYHAAGNVAAFDSAASEYRQSVPEGDSQWDRIAAMGYELSPGNELYRSVEQTSGEAGSVVEFDMDLSGMDDVPPETAIAGANDDARGPEAGNTEILPDSLEFTLDDAIEDEAEGLLDQTDEVTTKLDLARAYLDMEDPEGARNILQEVIEEGNEEQKSEAESLISNIA